MEYIEGKSVLDTYLNDEIPILERWNQFISNLKDELSELQIETNSYHYGHWDNTKYVETELESFNMTIPYKNRVINMMIKADNVMIDKNWDFVLFDPF